VLRPVGEGQWGVMAHLYCHYKNLLVDEATCVTCPTKASMPASAVFVSLSLPGDDETIANTRDLYGGNRAS
jgi:hypothetical protein